MAKKLKFILLLLVCTLGIAARAQDGKKMMELNMAYPYNAQPSSIQSINIRQHIQENFGSLEEHHRRIIPSGSLNFALNISRPLVRTDNFSNETDIFAGIGLQLEKRVTYVVENETLVKTEVTNQSLVETFDRETYRYFENLNQAKIQAGVHHTLHLNRVVNLSFRPQFSLGLPLQNSLLIGREVKREKDISNEDGKHSELDYIHLETRKIDQSKYTVLQAQISGGLDYKPFGSRLIFLNLSYLGSRNYYFVRKAKTIDHSSGFVFSVRSSF